MALTDRVQIVGDLLIVTDCDGNSIQYKIPCTCEDGSNPGTTPPPVAGSLCETSNYYAFGIEWICFQIQIAFQGQPDNFFGRNLAIAQVASALQLPVSPWAFYMSGYLAADNPGAAANRTNMQLPNWTEQSTHQILVCIVQDMLIQNGGIFTYEEFTTRMQAQGWYASGEIIAAIPLDIFMAHIYNLSNSLPPLEIYPGLVQASCTACNDVPVPIECPGGCVTTTCNKLIPAPDTGNAFPVTGYTKIIKFASTPASMWYGTGFQHLAIDMLQNRCVPKILVKSYTPCGAGGGLRSAHYRIEMDGTNVSEFKCSSLGQANYSDCGDVGGFDGAGTIVFEFDPPILGRHLNIVPLREELTIVQIDVITCNE